MGNYAVLGGGTMGCGVAQCLAAVGQVVVYEPAAAARGAGPGRVRDGVRLARMLRRTGPAPDEVLDRIRWTDRWEQLDAPEFVVECVPERLPLKEKVLRAAEEHSAPGAVFASCTSAIPVDHLAGWLGDPGRMIGTHFMNPAPLKDAVEVARGPRTTEETLRRTTELLTRIGKKAIVVGDAPGFVSNRVLMLTVNEAATVLHEGTADAATVDEVFRECFGHRMGPLRTADLIGLDTIVDTLLVLLEFTGDPRFRPSPLLAELVAAGHLGEKTGRGFHRPRVHEGDSAPA
ncbi:3-hydroxyacyl-CoA dehydrogenase family protein [Amycolatopsis sp. 195334CR]|uniref:3-hydroxyacyl-CoA dehydrogenase family protein n=1 Tax=Amycolatopsis sp. 195334CR TaxID=2814588 RepID=UPI001A902D0F|nr:3-hydroxyacyl-CoA dehydrogenase family protein [Amycolatopsis sp. 195334CR]MBN6039789.1 3-hydroxyacyl-CoA dehydrogenase family protein [Amycolatopsis sp. 195334CR]